MSKPVFDPTQPFESTKPAFDDAKAFTKLDSDVDTNKKTIALPEASATDTMQGSIDQTTRALGYAGQKIKDYFEKNKGQDSSMGEKLRTALENYGDSALFSSLPHAQASVGNEIGSPEYIRTRDENIKRLADESARNPKSADLGRIAGIGAQLLLGSQGMSALGAAMPETQAGKWIAGLGEKSGYLSKIGASALKAVPSGAAYGALQNPGDEEGKYNPGQLKERLQNALAGAKYSAIAAGGGTAIAELPTLAKSLKESSFSEAVKGLRPYRKEYRQMLQNKDAIQNTGRALLDNEVYSGMPKGSEETFEVVTKKLRGKGKEFEQHINALDEALKKKAMGEASGLVPQGGTPLASDVHVGIDRKAVADSVRAQLVKDVELPKTTEVNKQIEEYLTKFENSGKQVEPVKAAQKLKEAADEYAGWEKNPHLGAELTVENKLHRALSSGIKNGIESAGDAAVNHLGADLPADFVDSFQRVKKDYAGLSRAQQITRARALGDATVRFISPSDYGVALTTALMKMKSGDDMLPSLIEGAGLGLLHKGARLYGRQIGARGLHGASGLAEDASKVSPYAKAFVKSPVAVPISAWNLMHSKKDN